MNSLFGLGIGAGAFLLTKLPARFTSALGLAACAALMGAGATLHVGTADLRVIATSALLWGVVIGVVEPLLRTLMQCDAPPEFVGRIMGTAQVHRSAGEIVPLALATIPHAARLDRGRHGARSVRLAEALSGDDPISPLS